MIQYVKVSSLLIAFSLMLPSIASAQMEKPMSDQSSGMSHKMTKKQKMMEKKKMMMMQKTSMHSGGM